MSSHTSTLLLILSLLLGGVASVHAESLSDRFDALLPGLSSQDAATVDEINAWVDEKTEGLIESIVKQLDPDLVMLLINAIYFDGAWTYEFDPADTRRQSFFRIDGSEVEVDMMSIKDVELGFGGGVIDGVYYTAVELPYGGEAFSMVVAVARVRLR